MPKKYEQRNLGYRRVKSDAQILVTFSNGERWHVPAQLVADDRDENYKDEKEDTLGYIAEGSLKAYELTDWMSNNMNWSDLREYATKLPQKPTVFDYEADWCNADKEMQK